MISEFLYSNQKGFINEEMSRLLSMIFEEGGQTDAYGKDIGFARELTGIPEFDLFLDICAPRIEAIVGESLVPTYAFARKYFIGSKLIRHTDRPSCVYTATLTLSDSSTLGWPIYLEVSGRYVRVVNRPGDLLIFKGRELPHWRKSLLDGECLQLFLHYVPNRPEFEALFYDGRSALECHVKDIGISSPNATAMIDQFSPFVSELQKASGTLSDEEKSK